MNDKIIRIAKKIKEGGKNVVFTGAGISTESGIPDYRSQGGIWDKFRPVYFDEFMSSRDSREEYWRRWQELYQGIQQAQPNAGHTAIARLYQLGLAYLVYPFATHTRAAHAIETLNYAQKMVDSIEDDAMTSEVVDRIRMCALLHDIAHLPFSHTLEDENIVFQEKHDKKEIL